MLNKQLALSITVIFIRGIGNAANAHRALPHPMGNQTPAYPYRRYLTAKFIIMIYLARNAAACSYYITASA